MTFLTFPAWAAWSLLAAAMAAAVGAFLIPPRRPTQPVASLHVWQTVLDDPDRISLWSRVRRAVSLVLTAAIAAAAALALSKPLARSDASSGTRLLIVLDSSWSMGARVSSGGTRWDMAVERARAMIDAAQGREVAIATTADGVIAGPTYDMPRLVAALDRVRSGGGRDGGWPRLAGTPEVHFLTDGAQPRTIEPGVVVDSVFTPAANVAVTAFDVQPVAGSQNQAEAYLAVTNYAAIPQTVRLTVTRAADVLVTRSVPIGAGATYRDVIPVAPAGDARLRVHVSAADNALDIDDDAVSWLWSADPIRVGVVGSDSLVPGLLARSAGLRVSTIEPAAYASATADVWVFDRWLPPAPPSAAALLVEPPASSWAGAIGRAEPDPAWQEGSAHEILAGVDPEFLRLRKAVAIERPGLRAIVRSQGGTPLVSVEDDPSGRFVVLGFSTADSNIASTSAFPILMGNAIEWLGRPERGVRRSMGAVALPSSTTMVTSPAGQSVPLTRSANSAIADLRAPGLYRVDASGGASRVITVALDDPSRSDLRVSSVPAATMRGDAARNSATPWWTIAAWTALVLSAIEWLTWLRGVTV